jgi:hypothetical protein
MVFEIGQQVYDKCHSGWRIKTRFDTVSAAAELVRYAQENKRFK